MKMKKLVAIIALTIMALNVSGAKPQLVSRIDPTNWYVGLKDASLQLMVYGRGIRDAEVTVGRTDVTLDSLVRMDSPNYLLVYLSIGNAAPGELPLTFRVGGRRQTVTYQLLQREKAGAAREGFTNADVLYMLMPDRFAQGANHPSQVKGMNAYKEDRTAPSLRHGGDLEGIRQHLDYFNELGVTALWLTPVLENNSPDDGAFSTYHGYATTDYYRVDPRFGSNADYRRLIDECHKKGLKAYGRKRLYDLFIGTHPHAQKQYHYVYQNVHDRAHPCHPAFVSS